MIREKKKKEDEKSIGLRALVVGRKMYAQHKYLKQWLAY